MMLRSAFFAAALWAATPLAAQTVRTPSQLRDQLLTSFNNADPGTLADSLDASAVWHDGDTVLTGAPAIRKQLETTLHDRTLHLELINTRHSLDGEPRHPSALHDTGDFRETSRSRTGGPSSTRCGQFHFTYIHSPAGGWLFSDIQWTAAPCPGTP